jgi:hypothetical protein
MSFLGALADQVSSQLSLGENTNNSLDSVVNGQNVKYGSLGDFAKKFDQSAERRYVEEGYLRRDPFNADPKQFEVLMQEPNASIFIKKRMFSTIAENFRPDYMNNEEKLYYKAMRVLFANKCAQISALEKLSKIQSISASNGFVSDSLMPIILTLSDTILAGGLPTGSNLFGAFGGNPLGGEDASKLLNVTDKLRKLYAFNQTAQTTTWIVNSTDLFQSTFGQGTGTIEITNFTNFSTNVSVDGIKNPGSFTLNISDPYEAMLITEWDIEKAIADASNMFNNSSVFQLGKDSADQLIATNQAALNKLRADRGASPITVKVNPSTLLGKRVTAILDSVGSELLFSYDYVDGLLGNGVNVAEDYLRGGVVVGENGLDTSVRSMQIPGTINNSFSFKNTSELSAFGALITAIYTKIQLDANSQNAFLIKNQETNYARRKMRFNFSGKLIIQPMDIIHIYINSKSKWDNKLLGGLQNMFNGFGFAQALNSAASAASFSLNNLTSLFNPKSNGVLQAEKANYVGADFPDSLWLMLRSQFVSENEGTHVFAGVVESAQDSWSDGKFTMSISGKDNIAYFEQGKINFKPSASVPLGPMFDPLTPFKSNFDTINSQTTDGSKELLDENKAILGTIADKKGLLKAKSGPDAGSKVASDHDFVESFVDPRSGFTSRIFHAPDGLVYKWKEGIGVYTQFGSSLEIFDSQTIGVPNTFTEPFAGQDIMNVISLLVTGKPYNYAEYWKATQSIGMDQLNRDPQSKEDAANSYIKSLQSQLVKSNALWGNFIPFKNLIINEEAFARAQQAQFRIVNINSELNNKLKQLQTLNNLSVVFGASNVLTGVSKKFDPEYEKVKSQLDLLQTSINSDIKSIQTEEATFNAQSVGAGNDASFDFNEFIDTSKIGISASQPDPRREVRRQTNQLTRRMSYNVRANEDKNLFIVDDFYDKDYDILAYESFPASAIGLYNNEFTSTKDKIAMTADLLNLEVFADTQGNIRVRPPQYNKMPSSVFYRMMYLKQAHGVQIFPQFLDDLFSNQIDTLRKRLEVLEDLIRLDVVIILGITAPDDQAITYYILNGGVINSPTGASFSFISGENGGITDINQIMHSTNPDETGDQAVSFIDSLRGQATSTKDVFPNTARYTSIMQSLTTQNIATAGYSVNSIPSYNSNNYLDELINRIQIKSGQKINKRDYITVNNSDTLAGIVTPSTASIDIFKVTTELQDKLRERQKVLRLFYSVINNAKEFKTLDSNSTTATNQMLTPAIYGNSNIPEVFEHMIEDESYNDYGGSSGSRYVIKRAQIRSLQLSENPPDYTMVEVQGQLSENLPRSTLPQELNFFPSNGNAMVSALAVDYDAWRNYGFKNVMPVPVPFLSDPNSQCAPYAAMLLSRNRKNILRGTVTISGNEYMQPGEVVFLEDRGLLFYVTAVRHNFAFNSSFTTTLDLSYGHTPGEYIPNVLDVIGKMIYNNKDIAGYIVHRESNVNNEISMGVIQLDPTPAKPPTSRDTENKPQNSYATANSQVINNILYQAAYLINANNNKSSNTQASVELRVFYDDNNPANDELREFAIQTQFILTGIFSENKKEGVPTPPPFPAKFVSVKLVNLSDSQESRGPSQKAIDAARNLSNNSSIKPSLSAGSSDTTTPIGSNDKIRSSLFGYIVDCWVKFEQVTIESSGGT